MIEKSQLERMLDKSKKAYIDSIVKNKHDMKMFYSGRINVLCTLLELDEDEYFYHLITKAKKINEET